MAQGPSDEEQRRAERARNTDVMLQLATSATQLTASTTQLTASVDALRAQIAGSPNLLERVSAGHVRNAFGALLVVVSLSAIVGSAVALAWAVP